MDLLMQMFAPGGGRKAKPVFYPGDTRRIFMWTAGSSLAFAAYQTYMTWVKRNIDPSCEFVDQVMAMNQDSIIRDCFMNIQVYRRINPWLFKTALQNADSLLFLEQALGQPDVTPNRKDKAIAWSHFRMAVNRLNQFQSAVREKMGNDHALASYIYVKKIYSQLQKHFVNVLHMCSQFRPERLLKRAPLEVDKVMRQYEQGRVPDFNHTPWEKLKRRSAKYAAVSSSEDEETESSRESRLKARRRRRTWRPPKTKSRQRA